MPTPLPLTVVCLAPRPSTGVKKAFDSVMRAQDYLWLNTGDQVGEKTGNWRVVTAPQHLLTEMNFGGLRQWVLSQVTTKWVLFLDQDEWLEPKSDTQLAQLLQTDIAGFTLHRRDHFWGQRLRFGEAGNLQFLRLAQTAKMTWHGSVHEVATVKGQVRSSDLVIEHQPHQNVASFATKVQWYAQLAAAAKSSSAWRTTLELLLFPPAKFLHNFLLRSGWRDGAAGFCYATLMSWHSFLVRAYRLEKMLCPK